MKQRTPTVEEARQEREALLRRLADLPLAGIGRHAASRVRKPPTPDAAPLPPAKP